MKRSNWFQHLAAACVLLAGTTSFGQEPTFPDDDLRARVEALERQNQQLRQAIERRATLTDETRPIEEPIFTAAEEAAQATAAGAAGAAKGYEVGSDLKMSATWKDGLELSTANKDFRVHIGGRTQIDMGFFSVDQNVNNNINVPYGDGVDFRRARLRIDGTMYETIDWAAEYDFVNSIRVRNQPAGNTSPVQVPPSSGTTFYDATVTAPTDLWWQFKEIPFLGSIKIGNQKEQIGFEHIVSSRFLPFMERSYNQDAFYGGGFNGFVPGITALNNYGSDDQGCWAIGVYKPASSVFAYNTGDGDYSVTGRVTRLLWYTEELDSLVHVGFSARQASAYSQAGAYYANANSPGFSSGRIWTFRTRDAVRTGLSADWPVPAGITLFGDDMQWFNSELAAVFGSWTIQGEYLVSGLQDARTRVDGASVGTVTYQGGYVQVLKFLTGEHDHYSKKNGAFERVKPNENFFLVRDANGCLCRGRGAWQVGARYDYLDLNDKGLNGGILHNGTFGLNWFLNANSKLQFNYIATYRDAPGTTANPSLGDGWINGWGVRFAHDF
ncbi:MAG: porin [Planctomycetota bacterium]